MSTDEIQIGTPDGTADAYVSRPEDSGEHPGVLVLMDAFGLRPAIREISEQIASRGYTVLAPNLFYRSGRDAVPPMPDMSDEGARSAFMAKLGPLFASLTPDAVRSDGGAYLGQLAELAPGPVGITGYCLGARLGVLIAGEYPDRVAALAGFHGGRIVAEGPDSPHLVLPHVKAEIYFGHADNDQSMDPEQIAALNQAMDEAGVTYTTEVYEGAGHGYTMSDTPVYDAAATRRHYENLFALLGRTLPAG